MRQSSTVAKRYAEALLSVATETSKAEEYAKKLVELRELTRMEIVKDFLMNPVIDRKEKIDLLCSVLGEVDEKFKNFMEILVEKRRLNQIPLIADHFSRFLDEKMGKLKVWVVSAKKLSEDDLKILENALKKVKKVKDAEFDFQLSEDPTLIGGVRIFFDSEMMDLSIKGELERIENELFSS